MHIRGLRRSLWVPMLALPLVVPASGVLAHYGAAPVTAAAPVAATEPVDTQGNPVGADGSLPVTILPSDLLLANSADPKALSVTAGPSATLPSGPLGIPAVALDAYMKAAKAAPPSCHLQWSLLASIGRIESGHARGGAVDATGTTRSPILGPVLDGAGYAAIADTDGGVYDGDSRWDRAVGPMQFIPSTWRAYASDGNGDGRADPHNIFDSTVAAARYLCAGGLDTADPVQRAQAVFRYNHSDSYVATVLLWADAYAQGVHPTGPTGTLPSPEAPLALPAPEALLLPPLPGTPTPGEPVPGTTVRTAIPGTTTDSTTQPPTTTPSSPAPEQTTPPETTTPPSTTPPSSSEPTSTTTTPAAESSAGQSNPVTTAAIP